MRIIYLINEGKRILLKVQKKYYHFTRLERNKNSQIIYFRKLSIFKKKKFSTHNIGKKK